jgi:hypothetical protein
VADGTDAEAFGGEQFPSVDDHSFRREADVEVIEIEAWVRGITESGDDRALVLIA